MPSFVYYLWKQWVRNCTSTRYLVLPKIPRTYLAQRCHRTWFKPPKSRVTISYLALWRLALEQANGYERNTHSDRLRFRINNWAGWSKAGASGTPLCNHFGRDAVLQKITELIESNRISPEDIDEVKTMMKDFDIKVPIMFGSGIKLLKF